MIKTVYAKRVGFSTRDKAYRLPFKLINSTEQFPRGDFENSTATCFGLRKKNLVFEGG